MGKLRFNPIQKAANDLRQTQKEDREKQLIRCQDALRVLVDKRNGRFYVNSSLYDAQYVFDKRDRISITDLMKGTGLDSDISLMHDD